MFQNILLLTLLKVILNRNSYLLLCYQKKDTCFHSFSYAHKNCLLKVIDKHKSGWSFKWLVIKIARINGICIHHASWITFSNGLEGEKKEEFLLCHRKFTTNYTRVAVIFFSPLATDFSSSKLKKSPQTPSGRQTTHNCKCS